jgi:hypothetical protein
MNEEELLALLASMDEWLSNSEGLLIEDIIEWRDRLAKAIGKPERS